MHSSNRKLSGQGCGELQHRARFALSRSPFLIVKVPGMDTPPTKSTSTDAIDEIALLLVEMAEESDPAR